MFTCTHKTLSQRGLDKLLCRFSYLCWNLTSMTAQRTRLHSVGWSESGCDAGITKWRLSTSALSTVRQRACQAESTRRLASRMKWARGNADCRSPVATVLCSAWSQALWQFRNPNSAIRISLVAGRNFEPGTVGFQSALMSGFIKSQIR